MMSFGDGINGDGDGDSIGLNDLLRSLMYM